jgi:flagellar biosynthesis protein FlhF
MNVKTFTASTIQEALATAREKLGDEVVLLESAAANRTEPARVTVMADSHKRPPTNGRDRRSSRTSQRSGTRSNLRSRSEENTQNGESFSRPGTSQSQNQRQQRYQSIQTLLSDSNDQSASTQTAERSGESSRTSASGRGRLFSSSGRSTDTPDLADPPARTVELLEKQLTLLHERLDRMENRLGEALVGTAQRWTAHPLFSELLNKGLRPPTVSRLFDNLADSGFEPDRTDVTKLRWHLAQELRRNIDVASPKSSGGPVLFVGPSGAGKTTLLLKVAKNKSFFGRRNTAVISLLPRNEDDLHYQNPADLCKQCGLSVQTVRTPQEMQQALQRVAQFDQILIDSPPIPTAGRASARTTNHIRRLIEPVVPLEIHLVMNTTRTVDGYRAEQIEEIPLSFDCAALTHLDETNKWGRIAEWMMELSLPVRFVSINREMPGGVISFSPSWFIEEMMDLN